MENKKQKNITELIQKFWQPNCRITETGGRGRKESIKELIHIHFTELKDVNCLITNKRLSRPSTMGENRPTPSKTVVNFRTPKTDSTSFQRGKTGQRLRIRRASDFSRVRLEARSQRSNRGFVNRTEDLIKTFSFLHKFQKFTLRARGYGQQYKKNQETKNTGR